MPIRDVVESTGSDSQASPFVGPVDHTIGLKVDVSGLTDDEVDDNGYLKPGVPFKFAGGLLVLADGTAGEFIYGCVVEATKIADDNAPATLAAAADVEVAVAFLCAVNRDILEDVLGRALTANEIAAFAAAGSLARLLPT